jgi:hypothetical protein
VIEPLSSAQSWRTTAGTALASTQGNLFVGRHVTETGRTDWAKEAADAGIAMPDLEARAKEMRIESAGLVKEHNDLMRDAYRLLEEHGVSRQKITSLGAKGGDYAKLKGFDDVADLLKQRLAPLQEGGEGADDALWRIVSGRQRTQITKEDSYRHALDELTARKEYEAAVAQAKAVGHSDASIAESTRSGQEDAQDEVDEGQGAEAGGAPEPSAADLSFDFGANEQSSAGPSPGELRAGGGTGNPFVDGTRDLLKGEEGFVNLDVLAERAKAAYHRLKDATGYIADEWAKMVNTQAPAILRLSRPLNVMAGKLSATSTYVEKATPFWIDRMLGPNLAQPVMDGLLGTTFYEERFRTGEQALLQESARQSALAAQARRAGNTADAARFARAATEAMVRARNVRTFIGAQNQDGWAPLPDEATYQQSLASPEYQQFSQRWAAKEGFVQRVMEPNYRAAMGLDETDPIISLTQIPGRPFNAAALQEGETSIGQMTPRYRGGPLAGRLKNALLPKYGFAKQAGLDADSYDTRVTAMIRNTFEKGQLAANKAQFVRVALEEGVGRAAPPGQRLDGYKEVEFMKLPPNTPNTEPGDVLYLPHPLVNAREGYRQTPYDELRQILRVDQPASKVFGAVAGVNAAFNRANLLIPTAETTAHVRNQLSMAVNPRTAWNLPRAMYDFYTQDPDTMQRIVDLAQLNAMKPAGMESPGWANGRGPLGKFLDFMDTSMRVAMDRAFDSMVRSGLVEDDPVERRNFIQQLGNYDKGTQSRLVTFLRESGFGPYATAATRFTTEGLRSLTGEPGVKATSWGAAAQLRGEKLAGVATLLGSAMALNYLLNKRVDGDDNTPLGAVKVGQNADGSPMYVDFLATLTGLPRGLRALGVLPIMQALHQGTDLTQARDKGTQQMLESWLHPVAGPSVQAAYTAASGYNLIGQKLAEEPGPGETKHEEYLKAAAYNVNPLVAAATGKYQAGQPLVPTTLGGAGARVSHAMGPFGVKNIRPPEEQKVRRR